MLKDLSSIIDYEIDFSSKNNIRLKLLGAPKFNRFLEEDFNLPLVDVDQYISAYKENGFIDAKQSIVDWDNLKYLTNLYSSFEIFLNELVRRLELIVIGESDLELIAKLSLFFNSYSFSRIWQKEILFDTYELSFKENLIDFELKIRDYEIYTFNNSSEFKVKYSCDILDYDNQILFNITILVYSPLGLVNDGYMFKGHHIITNKFDDVLVRNFITRTIKYLKASSFEELKLKLSLFASNINKEELLLIPLTDNPYYRLREKYK